MASNNKSKYQRLSKEEWSEHYNLNVLNNLIKSIEERRYNLQTSEMLKFAKKGDKILEIGAGSGQSSICLAQNGCEVTALDFSQSALNLIKIAAEKLDIKINTICYDANEKLPFREKEFDIIFHAGLLEHFTTDERIRLLKLWKPYCKKMVSMVPNAASIGYRLGKAICEKNGTWSWGMEMPLYTQIGDFITAGYVFKEEYTVGEINALNFLDDNNKFKQFMLEFWSGSERKVIDDNCHQGYLLITIANNEGIDRNE